MIQKLVLASGNAGKLREFARLLTPLGVEVVSQKTLGIEPVPEPHCTFLENALAKARHASEQSGLPALADDSGLCVPALGGAPGVLSARFATPQAGQDQDSLNNQKLVESMAAQSDRRGFYVALLVLVRHAQDPLPVVAQAVWHGEIVDQARGQNGFGYDPHFWLPARQMTVAQLDPEVKNRISHRAMATDDLIAQTQTLGLIEPVTPR
ncbi:RdgB/HAM1 family non-canonical purine NTP pyrophosphatase [Orrella marina]|uniref:RdgB/HAM1 family non-canonical purine NTP pyrophosphatase n=1 Tax=Orrella marina TaxID=2163011 RepID=UPI00131F128F|nr:RdgB/HAM1 family non-canonical purine NTP pyrophosphatase [Orrella marina]